MARGLQALLAGLAGAGRAGVDYYGQKRETERVAAEREAERQRLQDQFDKQFGLQQAQFDATTARNTAADARAQTEFDNAQSDRARTQTAATMVQYGLDEALPTDTAYDALKHKLRVNTEVTPGAALGPSQVPQVGPSYGLSAAPAQGEAVDAAPTVTSTPMAGPEAVGLGGVKDTRGFKTPAEVTRGNLLSLADRFDAEGNTLLARQARAQADGVQGIAADTLKTPAERDAETGATHLRRLEEIDRMNTNRGGATISDAVLTAVRENPRLMAGMTPSRRTAIQEALINSGFSNLGTELNPTELGLVQERFQAMVELGKLQEKMGQAVEKLGPIAGWSRLNPYDVDARSLLADIDLARQRVGKALEGGVLRKEDEEKYKRILAVTTDAPEVAFNKIVGLITTLQNDQKVFEQIYGAAGYRIPDFSQAAGGGVGPTDTLELEIGPDGKLRPKGGG